MVKNIKKLTALVITLCILVSFIGLSVYAEDINLSELEAKYSLKYAKSLFIGNKEYPKLLDDSIIGSVPEFEDGDRVVFVGDSISHGPVGAYYMKQIFSYYATRYPNTKFSYINKGISADKVSSILARMKHDVLDFDYEKPFNKAVVLIGTNDMSRKDYYEGEENKEGAFEKRAMLLSDYYVGLMEIAKELKENGAEQIYFINPPLFDHWLKYEEDENGKAVSAPGYATLPLSVDFNNIMRKGGAIAYNVASTFNESFIDVNTPQTIIQYYNRFYKNDEAFTMANDRIHPTEAGHYIMTYVFLKAQGETGEVATVNVNIADNSINASNAEVSNLNASNDKVSYTYKANSLPLAADEYYRNAEKYLPLTYELNREIIKVSGLNDGMYDIKMDGNVVMTVTAKELTDGVNIADMENNPGQKQALLVFGLAEARRNLDTAHRNFIKTKETPYITKYSLDATSNATLIASAKDWIEKNPDKTSDIKLLNTYLDYKNKEKETIETINSFEDLVYKINKPYEHLVVIEKSTKSSTMPSLMPVYIDYEIPEEIYPMYERRIEGNISVYINEELLNTDVKPVITEGRTLVPLRAIFEVFGAKVEWDEKTATATATLDGKEIKLTENQKTTYVDGKAVELDVPATILNGRFVVPVRFVSETLGASVKWDDWGQNVLITK